MDKKTTIEQLIQRLNSAFQKRDSLQNEIEKKEIDLKNDIAQLKQIEKTISDLKNQLSEFAPCEKPHQKISE